MVRINNAKTSHDYYYAKWNGTAWVKTFLDNGGGHFHQTENLEKCYSGGMAIDPDNTNVIYCSVPVEGAFGKVYEIVKYTMSDDGVSVLNKEQITMNSKLNNVRPFIIPNSAERDIRLAWMYGNYYDWIVSNSHPTAYGTAIHTEKLLPKKAVNLLDADAADDYTAIGGAFKATKETANLIETAIDGDFSVSAEIFLDDNYEGTLMEFGGIRLAVKMMETQYGAVKTGNRARVVLNIDGIDYVSPNVYGSSDCWKTYGRGTGGNYGVENYGGYVTHTITYDGEYITLYREGLVDLKIPYSRAIVFDSVAVGGFDGLADDVAVYARALNHDEIRSLADVEKAVTEPAVTGNVEIIKNYADIDGTVIRSAETITLNPGSDIYHFVPEDRITVDSVMYRCEEALSDLDSSDNLVTAVYVRQEYGENIMTNGSFEDENGNFSLDGWMSAKTFNAFGSPYTTNHSYAVGKNSLITDSGNVTASANEIPDGEWALGTRWNDGAAGLCSLMRYVGVESGKTYEISFRLKHKNANADGGYLKISLVDEAYRSNDAAAVEKNTTTPGIVGNIWTTYTRQFTATDETDYVLFWFRWLGDGDNTGKGPFWYFDDFKIREIKDAATADVIVDGVMKTTYGTVTLGDEGALPAGVTGYRVTSGTDESFVKPGTYSVVDGDIIETVKVNVSAVMGAQVRYGNGVDNEGRVSDDSGLRFIAEIDRSNSGGEITGYGMRISAESSDKYIDVDAQKYQNTDETVFTAALTNMAVSNYNRAFTATPYVKVKYTDGEEAVIFAENGITRSVYQVAAGLLKSSNSDEIDGADSEYEVNSNMYKVLNAYVNMVGVRLTLKKDGVFTARTEGSGAYSGDVFFDVTSSEISEGVYTVTITPLESFENKVTIMEYWDEFVRVNNNHSSAVNMITNSVKNSDGSVTFTFTVK